MLLNDGIPYIWTTDAPEEFCDSTIFSVAVWDRDAAPVNTTFTVSDATAVGMPLADANGVVVTETDMATLLLLMSMECLQMQN